MSDIKGPKDNKEEDQQQPLPDNLDELHEKAQREFEEEDAKASDDKSKDDEEQDDTDDSNKQDEDDKESKDDEDTGDKEGDNKADEGPEDDAKIQDAKKSEADNDEEEAKVADIPKIKVKDSNGKVLEIGSVDELPDDFEPDSYKDFSIALRDLTKRERDVEKADADKVVKQQEAERKAKIAKMQEGWDNEIKELTESKLLPEDATERKKVVEAVFEFMGEQIGKGRPVDSFEIAFESYSYRQQKEEQAKKKIEDKKKAGNKVMGSGSPAPSPSQQGKTIEAPPRGISLDDVHAKVLGTL